MKYLIIISLLLMAVWNAYVILWKTENSKKYSKIWHSVGLAIRVLMMVIPFLFFSSLIEAVKWSLVAVAIGGVIYDFIINAIRYYYTGHPDLWYVDNKGWNKVFLKYTAKLISLLNKIPYVNIKVKPATVYWILRGVFVVGTIIYLFINN